MPEDRPPILSSAVATGRSLTSAGISTVSGIASLWLSLEVQVTGSGLALSLEAAEAISGFAAFGIVGGTLALAAAPVLLSLGAIASFSRDEATLHDVATGAGTITEFTS